MGRAEKGSIKWLANKMKSKGLQKLRWYCQMCEKQCRDENGFKCHTQSESHQRQLLIFGDNPNKFLSAYSNEFLNDFIKLLKRTHGTKRVKANKFYQEYIGDKNHVHMNSTQWHTLTSLCLFLGKKGICKVDETDEGWFLAWIDRDPETIERQKRLEKKDKAAKNDEEIQAEFIRAQIERHKTGESDDDDVVSDDELHYLKRKEGVSLPKIELRNENKMKTSSISKVTGDVFDRPSSSKMMNDGRKDRDDKRRKMDKTSSHRKESNLAQIVEEERRDKSRVHTIVQSWIECDIIVKVIECPTGKAELKNRKGRVVNISPPDIATVVIEDVKLKLREDQLETVIPALNRKVKVLKGKYKGEIGVLKSLEKETFSVSVELMRNGKTKSFMYDEISKLFQQS